MVGCIGLMTQNTFGDMLGQILTKYLIAYGILVYIRMLKCLFRQEYFKLFIIVEKISFYNCMLYLTVKLWRIYSYILDRNHCIYIEACY